jgi:DNA-binding transcriptional MocR family regulator
LPQSTELHLTRKANEHGIATPSLSALYNGTTANDGWIFGFSALQPREIEDAVAALSKLKLPNVAST